jgi:hypothetical protein
MASRPREQLLQIERTRESGETALSFTQQGENNHLKSPWAAIRDPWFKAMEQFAPDADISAVP